MVDSQNRRSAAGLLPCSHQADVGRLDAKFSFINTCKMFQQLAASQKYQAASSLIFTVASSAGFSNGIDNFTYGFG